MNELRRIQIVEYRPQWADEFEAISGSLREALGPLAMRIDHIGSTSVPGLAAKDVIDVQVMVHDFMPDLEVRFARAGYHAYFRWPELNSDHRPPMASGPDGDWEKQYFEPSADSRRVHVHVRRAGSPNGRYALLFRDYLRAHPLAAAAYAQVKCALAEHGPTDWDLYYDVKDPVCDILMAGAEEWAVATNWETGHYS